MVVKMNKRLAKVATIVFLAFLVMVSVVWAVYRWNMSITWTYADLTIGVYTDMGCTTPWNHNLHYDNVENGTSQIENFYIRNEGNIIVNVTISEVTKVGCIASWSPTLLNLNFGTPSGEVGLMELNLTIVGEGTYEFDFASEKA